MLSPVELVRGDTAPRDALRGKRHTVTFPCALSAKCCQARRRHRVAEVNHASDATRGAAGNASEGVGSARPGAKNGLFDRWRHVAERCVSRVVELGSRKQAGVAVSRIDRALGAKRSPLPSWFALAGLKPCATGSDTVRLKPDTTETSASRTSSSPGSCRHSHGPAEGAQRQGLRPCAMH